GFLEAEGVGRRKPRLALLERARIGQLAEALAGGDPEGIVALRAHAPGALGLGALHDLLARVAFDPEALGDDDLARLGGLLFGLASEPGHKPYAPFRPARSNPARSRALSSETNHPHA